MEIKELNKITEANVLEDFRLEILGKKLKPNFLGASIVFDCDEKENE